MRQNAVRGRCQRAAGKVLETARGDEHGAAPSAAIKYKRQFSLAVSAFCPSAFSNKNGRLEFTQYHASVKLVVYHLKLPRHGR
jgi:hypothetical protein